jgi:SagB-type dehydrogenase family enzyme
LSGPGPDAGLPRLPYGLVRFDAGESYVIEGGPLSTVLTGPGAREILPALCDLLDGTHTVAQLSERLAIPHEDVEAAIGLLWRQGILEFVERDHQPAHQAVGDDALAFLSRNAGFMGRVPCAEQAVERLQRCRVLVAGPAELAVPLSNILTDSGLTVEVYRAHAMVAVNDRSDGWIPDVLVVEVLAGPSFAPVLIDDCHEAGVTWMGIGAVGPYGFVGPMSHHDYSCPLCIRVQFAIDVEAPTDAPTLPVDLVCGLAAAELVHAVTGVGSVRTAGQRIEIRWDPSGPGSMTTTMRRLGRLQACAQCGDTRLSGASRLPWDYEQDIADPPPHFWPPAALRNAPDTRALQNLTRALPTCPSVPAGAPNRHPALSDLGELLRLTVGMKGERGADARLRAIPSAGNLASAQAFLLSREEIDGLESHAAWYDASADRFVASGRVGLDEVEQVLSELTVDGGWDWLIVWTTMVAKLAVKYRDFSLRLAHLDAGVALVHATIVARAIGLDVGLVARWKAAPLVALLDLDPEGEIVTGLMALRRTSP